MNTGFSEDNMAFTKKAHHAAQTQFYPQLWPGQQIDFEDTVGTIRDLEYAVDCIVAVSVVGLSGPLRFTIQERWRRPPDRYGDVTITEWNLATGQPSELHKLGAHLFVYGFYEEETDSIETAVAVDIPAMLLALSRGDLDYARKGRIDQSFVGFRVTDLRDAGCVLHQMRRKDRS